MKEGKFKRTASKSSTGACDSKDLDLRNFQLVAPLCNPFPFNDGSYYHLTYFSKPVDSAQERTSKPPARKEDGSDVRWFEKDVESGDIKRVADNPEDSEAGEVRRRLGEMTARMRQYDASIDSKEYHDTVLDAFPEEERRTVAKLLAEERKRKEEQEKSLRIQLPRNEATEPILRRFNKQVVLVTEKPEDATLRKDLWKWYKRAKKNIPGLDSGIPDAAWHVLWRSVAEKTDDNIYREERLLELSQGMAQAGVVLLPEEAEAKYEAMVMRGESEEAVLQWRREYERLQGKDQSNLQHGIKLFAAVGEIRKGFRIVRQYLQQFPQADPRVLHPLVQASIQTSNDHMAYALYMTLRDKLGGNMEMKDYDVIIARFLSYSKKDLALAVFRDMMIQGTRSVQKKQITLEEERKLREDTMRRIDVLHAQSISGREINEVSQNALASLPVQWQNKFFFGSWIKKLIGMDDLDGATKVVELMYQRGIAPDATHVNGIVGGLMRSNVREQEDRGQSVAWAMIYRRIAYVTSRSGHNLDILRDFDSIPADSDASAQKLPLDLSRPVPHANVETFNVLGLHYLLTSQWPQLQHLRRMLKPANIPMSSFFMDHLLYMQLYTNGPSPMWSDFLHYTETTNPDMETFNALWHASQEVTNPTRRLEPGTFPPPRALFKIMTDWRATLNHRLLDKMTANFTGEIYARIIATFCNRKDFAGCIVAMHAVHAHFGAAPDGDVAGLVVTGLSNVYEGTVPQVRARRGRRQMRRDEGKTSAVEQVLALVRARRAERLRREGVDVEEMDEAAVAEENVNALSELVRTVLVRIQGDPAEVEEAVRAASVEMGVAGLPLGDVEASGVS
ncbi:hypothetical protein C1H76_4584 [Elsinoe australis]|uniref:Pentatricopeptide repeat protein n=1 Tax=Elsinoe australis TaxID=40998 RepID=A0A4U7B5V7_9PEZI|nr:hypothetical protein C1H76_4584 [Elsinoe australis]